MKKIYMLLVATVCSSLAAFAQPEPSYNAMPFIAFSVAGQNPTPTGCFYGDSDWVTQYGFSPGGFATASATSCGSGGSCVFSSSASTLSIDPGPAGNVQNFAYVQRPVTVISGCTVSPGVFSTVFNFTVSTYNPLAVASALPSTVCSNGPTLNLASYVSADGAILPLITYKLDGNTITSSLDPATVPAGPHTVTAEYLFANGLSNVSLGSFNLVSPASGVTNPADQTICGSGNAAFTISASGSGLTYQWQESWNGGASWSDLTGAGVYGGTNTPSLTVSNPGTGYNNFLYRCFVNDAGGCNPTTTSAAKLGIFGQVAITGSPSDQNGCINGSANFVASGTPRSGAMQFQWQEFSSGAWNNLNNQAYPHATVSGANTGTLALSALQTSASGRQYRAILQDDCGAVNANSTAPATLTMLPPVAITAQPTAKSVCGSGSATFTVAASGNGALSYQWQFSSNNGASFLNVTNGGNYSGADTESLTITNGASFNNFQYRCVATDACGPTTETSNAALFTIIAPVSGVANPTDQTICGVGVAAFTTSGTGTGITFQWQESANGGASWSDLTSDGVYGGTNSPSLTVSNPGTGYNNFLYRCFVNDAGGCNPTTTSAAKLGIFGQVGITGSPSDQNGCIGGSANFVASGTPRSGALQFQWQEFSSGAWNNLNNQAYPHATVSGANTGTLALSALQTSASGRQYRAILQDDCGAVNANSTAPATLTMLPPVAITAQPTAQSVCGSGAATFTVAASGNGALSYQWQFSPNDGASFLNVTNGGNYSGANTASLTITNGASFNNFQYRCVATDACGPTTATSNAALLTIIANPSITSQPAGSTICQGASASLNVGASGSSLSYQWQKGGTNISGANSSTYTLPNALPSNSGNYTVVVSNTCLSTTSNIAILTVNATTAIGSQPSSVAVCPGANTSFSVTASGTGPFTYKWEKNTGGAWFTVGGNSASLSIAPAANQDIAQYRVNVQGSCGEAISNNVALTLNPIPSIPTVADVARCGPGTLAATAASSSPSPTFNWYSNSGDLSPVFTGATRTISSLSVTTTQYASVVSLGCESPRKAVVFTLNPIKNVPLGNSLTLCAGQAAYNLENDIADPVAKGNNFTWSAGGTNFSSKTFDPVVVGLGTYTVSYNPPSVAQATPHCYVNTTRTVQVTTGAVSITFTDPLVSAGNTVNTCVGNAPITISSFPSVPGGTWSTVSGSGISSSGATTLFTPDASNFTATNPNVFRYSVSSGGCSGTKDLYIFVKDNQAPPIVSGLPALVCPSTNLSLSASVSITGTYTYDWFKPGQQNPFTSGASLSFPVNGNEDIFVRSVNSFNCRSSATQVSIRTPFGAGAITVNKSNVEVGEMVKFSYSVNNSGNTYEWEFGDGGRSREFSPAYYFYKPAQYSVKLKVISTIGCTQNTQFDFITVTGTPVNVVTAADDVAIPNKVSFYPNPVASELTIEAPFPVLEYSVMDMSGRAIASERPTGERTFKVDASGLEPGMYVLRIGTTDKKKFSLKFIKQ